MATNKKLENSVSNYHTNMYNFIMYFILISKMLSTNVKYISIQKYIQF